VISHPRSVNGKLRARGGLRRRLTPYIWGWVARLTLLAAGGLSAAVIAAAGDAVLVVGGNRGTGLEIVRVLKERGQPVTVMARQTSDISALEQLGIPVVRADALQADQVESAIERGRYRAVISTLGASEKDAVSPDFEGNRNVIDAAKSAGIPRFVLVTVIGAGDSAETPPLLARWMLKDVIARKDHAEQYLRASGLQYTIVRPGGLLDKSASGKAVLSQDPETFSWIARADLAQLVADALDDQQTIGKTYSAFDATRERFWSRWRD
jgi:uncharacterized protein YbjT (DUF2867 family)